MHVILASVRPAGRSSWPGSSPPSKSIPAPSTSPPSARRIPVFFAMAAAEAKARDVAARHPEALVIGADTIVCLEKDDLRQAGRPGRGRANAGPAVRPQAPRHHRRRSLSRGRRPPGRRLRDHLRRLQAARPGRHRRVSRRPRLPGQGRQLRHPGDRPGLRREGRRRLRQRGRAAGRPPQADAEGMGRAGIDDRRHGDRLRLGLGLRLRRQGRDSRPRRAPGRPGPGPHRPAQAALGQDHSDRDGARPTGSRRPAPISGAAAAAPSRISPTPASSSSSRPASWT